MLGSRRSSRGKKAFSVSKFDNNGLTSENHCYFSIDFDSNYFLHKNIGGFCFWFWETKLSFQGPGYKILHVLGCGQNFCFLCKNEDFVNIQIFVKNESFDWFWLYSILFEPEMKFLELQVPACGLRFPSLYTSVPSEERWKYKLFAQPCITFFAGRDRQITFSMHYAAIVLVIIRWNPRPSSRSLF
jgi:hypothetical protein